MSTDSIAARCNALLLPETECVTDDPEGCGPCKKKKLLLALLSNIIDSKDGECGEEPMMDPDPGALDMPRAVNSREGSANFYSFENYTESLDRQLQLFINPVRQLGSSIDLMTATYKLRKALLQMEHLFRENAANMFTEVPRTSITMNVTAKQQVEDPHRVRKPRHTFDKDRIYSGMKPRFKPITDLEELPAEMRRLSSRIQAFSDQLNDIPEFTEELVNTVFSSFAADLMYRAACLGDFKGEFRTKPIQCYINDLTVDISAHMEGMRSALDTFIKVGIPVIRASQEHTANGLLNLATIATFFSSVTATTLQFSYADHGAKLSDLVNALWMSSLVFSIASAIGAPLAYQWRTSKYCFSRSRASKWIEVWIMRIPICLLVVSVVSFVSGICLFTYSSGQSRLVRALITVFTMLISIVLFFIAFRVLFERLAHARVRDCKLDPAEIPDNYLGFSWMVEHWPKNICKITAEWAISRVQCMKVRLGAKRPTYRHLDDEENSQARNYPVSTYSQGTTSKYSDGKSAKWRSENHTNSSDQSISKQGLALGRRLDIGSVGVPNSMGHSWFAWFKRVYLRIVGMAKTKKPKPTRLKAIVERVIVMNRVKRRMVPAKDMPVELDIVDQVDYSTDEQRARIKKLRNDFANLHIAQSMSAHVGLVKYMQFNPQGTRLATCSWDRTVIVWSVMERDIKEHKRWSYAVTAGGRVNQVAWSPDGSRLLTRTLKELKVWDVDNGSDVIAIRRPHAIQSMVWIPNGSEILSIEHKFLELPDGHTPIVTDTHLVQLNMEGTVVDRYELPRIRIWEAAIMADQTRVVAVGTLLKTANGLEPTKSRAEKRLLVYNMITRSIEHQVPLLQDVCNITLKSVTPESTYALVSYTNKTPPQMWRIDMKPNNERYGMLVARLNLVCSYLTKSPVEFAEQSFFGGLNDELVCCLSKNGEVFIWDRYSTALLHILRSSGGDVVKSFACNQKAPSELQFATGALEGMLRLHNIELPSDSPPDLLDCVAPRSASMGT